MDSARVLHAKEQLFDNDTLMGAVEKIPPAERRTEMVL